MWRRYFLPLVVVLTVRIRLAAAATDCPARIVSGLHQKDCTDRSTNDTAYYLDRKECIPKCSVYPTSVTSQECTADPDRCVAGYNCEKRCNVQSYKYSCETDTDCYTYNMRAKCNKYCVPPNTDDDSDSVTCMAYHSNLPQFVDKWWTAIKFKPVCDDDGNWQPKQCKGGLQGRCLCYSSKGVRLFGQALYTDSSDMTCACSRLKSDLEQAGRRSSMTLHCDSKGNFEALQCDEEKKLCWCAERLTGDLTGPVVPKTAMKQLPCHSVTLTGSQYLRQCESKKFATTMATVKMKRHGVVSVESDSLLCDADGSYGAYAIQSGIAYCTWRDNSKIGTWQASLSGLNGKLTCNCARDFYMYAHSKSCEGTGDYVILQQVIDAKGQKKYYCVDEEGFAKTDLLDSSTINCTLYY